MIELEKIDHICIAVKDRAQAEARFKDVFGLEPDERYVDQNEKIDVARYYIGDVGLELVAPTTQDSEVAKFIRRRGEGLFLLSLKVPDTGKTLDELKQRPVELIDQAPRTWQKSRFAFLHPKSLFGVLFEIID
ncbi:MAG TPA: VOC family protein [Desulfomonilaceae bacterium]|nr:VOC family protein [Desulfomonilaceae bacterium]HVN79937.1 VOC family protein [Terriglobia bacterium]